MSGQDGEPRNRCTQAKSAALKNSGTRQFNGAKAVLSTKIISHVNVKKKIYTDLNGT